MPEPGELAPSGGGEAAAGGCASASDCSEESCSGCPSATGERPKLEPHASSNIKHVIAVVSGKGGVGKSLVTTALATSLQRAGRRVGVLDADITGPSMARAFGLDEKLRACADGILPSVTAEGIQLVSTNLILPDETTPVLWRGTIISGLVRQFFQEVLWGELDYLLIDMPPGTGDVPLTVYQSLPIDGIVIVTAPQGLVSMIVGKAINMAETMEVPVLGIVQNMAYFVCPDCGSRHDLFGRGDIAELAEHYGISLTAEVAIDPEHARKMDAGRAAELELEELTNFVTGLEAKVSWA
ncbi:MAG: Mrp/NBP35 family ATP-binding protein [Coriobacteriales bacterium]|nr:Mrp/NBP35 family ATP-binding protein [Coriobacteriales bacterium]